MAKKYVFFFSKEFTEGKKELRELLGGKGANLAEMCRLELPVPPGFTITTEACEQYYNNGKKLPRELKEEVYIHMEKLEHLMGKKLGDKDDPLLVSVRSGAAVSMPGMMDTILNLGINDQGVNGLAGRSGNERFAYDSYRRFIQGFGNVVLEVEHHKFEHILETLKEERGVFNDVDLEVEDLKMLVSAYKKKVLDETGEEFPSDPKSQLWKAIDTVFSSWHNARAKKYRQLNRISSLNGTAVNIQSMVFGNLSNNSGTVVAFSRNPSTGENELYGEYLMNAQGEDVVLGIRTPLPVAELMQQNPGIYKKMIYFKDKLEMHYKDMQDMEFTIQEGDLYILQTRNGKRTGSAAAKIAVDMVHKGMISKKEAVLRVEPIHVEMCLWPHIDPSQAYTPLAKGLPASPGAAVGKIVFSADKAEKMALSGEKVILIRKETSPEDIGGMDAAQGILTATGGMTSHAGGVARGMGKCCVAGCGDLVILSNNTCEISGKFFKEGDMITLNGTTGDVVEGALRIRGTEIYGNLEVLMEWVNEVKTIKVRANANTPGDIENARKFGAEGIGLCCTEHMFFEGERINAMRRFIMLSEDERSKRALYDILPMQKKDFVDLFTAAAGLPIAIRFLDCPLHEFLPHSDEEMQELAKQFEIDFTTLKERSEQLKEYNPMLGHRGSRLAVTYPEILLMQTEAVIIAGLEVQDRGIKVLPELMIPMLGTRQEFLFLKEMIEKKAKGIFRKTNGELPLKVGAMIEIPRACLEADKIAEEADFFSFATNDLTQMTFGYSRYDAGIFIPEYVEKGILSCDPFKVLDQEGLGQLLTMGIKKGREAKPGLEIGICGEHCNNAHSVEFCCNIGMDYVSCSPINLPVTRLAAAQAELKRKNNIL